MVDEEEAWRAQRPTSDPTSDSEEDEIKPGCYVLDIDSTIIGIKSIWVRAEYIRIYDYLVKYYDEETSYERITPAAVLTGQPGGRVSGCIMHCAGALLKGGPVIWHFDSTPYIFVEEGVYDMGEHFSKAVYKSVVWTLVDSDNSQSGMIPDGLVKRDKRFFVIFAASPRSERWSRLHKTVSETVVVMNPWTRSEIHRAAPLLKPCPSREAIDDVYDRLGPTPRLCLTIAARPRKLREYEDAVCIALNNLSMESIEKIIGSLIDLKMSQMSQNLFLIRREDIDNVASGFLVLPSTDPIRSRLITCMRNTNIRQLIKVFQLFFPISSARVMSGYIFENICHQLFQTRIQFPCTPMVRFSKGDGTPIYQPQWNSSHNEVTDRKLEELCQVARNRQVVLDMVPLRPHEYDDLELTPESGVYYIPKKQNEAGFGSFIRYDGILYIFQFIVFDEHSIDNGLISRFAECTTLPQRNNWRYILSFQMVSNTSSAHTQRVVNYKSSSHTQHKW